MPFSEDVDVQPPAFCVLESVQPEAGGSPAEGMRVGADWASDGVASNICSETERSSTEQASAPAEHKQPTHRANANRPGNSLPPEREYSRLPANTSPTLIGSACLPAKGAGRFEGGELQWLACLVCSGKMQDEVARAMGGSVRLLAGWCGRAGASALSWSGPPECRESEQLAFQVQRALGAPLADTGHVHLQVHIERVTPDARALLRITSADSASEEVHLKERLLVAPDCATLVDTLAVAIALAVEAAAPQNICSTPHPSPSSTMRR